jgi:serine phosphatase RsbU (regulator of sigma subunit)
MSALGGVRSVMRGVWSMLDTSNLELPAAGASAAEARAADAAYFAAFDAQRAKVLRRRIQWYCILAIWLMSFSTVADLYSLVVIGSLSRQEWLEMMSLMAMIGLYAAALVYLAKKKPDRPRLVEVLTSLTCVVLMMAMFFEVIVYWARPEFGADAAALQEAQVTIGWKVTLAFGFLFSLACVLVPMTVRESARIAGVGLAVFVVIMAVLIHPPLGTVLWLGLLFSAFTGPGMAWSWWRFREFDARFRAEALLERFENLSGEVKEISAELTQARRLHEALFPAPVTAGPVQFGFAYAPMREIGGDFVFVHREPGRDGTAGDGALTIVLIDVSGHGIPAALSVNRLHGELLRFFAHYPAAAGESGRPGHVLSSLNAYACAALAPQGVYATALVVRICPVVGTIEFANGGHPTAYVRRGSGQIVELPSTATMLGVLDAELYEIDARELSVRPGDRVLAYTDGAMETRDKAGADFSAERIRGLVESTPLPERPGTGRLAPIADAVMKAVDSHRHGPAQDDTLIVELVFAAGVRSVPASSASREAAAAV